ncbi:MAG: TraR/DksA family transcriptional regulator [Candidatus Kaiserbacteria bacterium]|nr:TraR/DksA family transcriptional regulator [Candidatus Kaiserbacteria bacterium]
MKTEYFKKKLEEEKIKLESEMGSIGRRNPAVPNDWEPTPLDTGMESNPIDQADVTTNRENNVAVLADLEARYDAVLAALLRIDTKTYGKCEVCGKEIGEARLEADPAATTCVLHL